MSHNLCALYFEFHFVSGALSQIVFEYTHEILHYLSIFTEADFVNILMQLYEYTQTIV